jgi:hypothetical protein
MRSSQTHRRSHYQSASAIDLRDRLRHDDDKMLAMLDVGMLGCRVEDETDRRPS